MRALRRVAVSRGNGLRRHLRRAAVGCGQTLVFYFHNAPRFTGWRLTPLVRADLYRSCLVWHQRLAPPLAAHWRNADAIRMDLVPAKTGAADNIAAATCCAQTSFANLLLALCLLASLLACYGCGRLSTLRLLFSTAVNSLYGMVWQRQQRSRACCQRALRQQRAGWRLLASRRNDGGLDTVLTALTRWDYLCRAHQLFHSAGFACLSLLSSGLWFDERSIVSVAAF